MFSNYYVATSKTVISENTERGKKIRVKKYDSVDKFDLDLLIFPLVFVHVNK